MIETVDSVKLAKELHKHLSNAMRDISNPKVTVGCDIPLRVLVQVKTSDEESA